MSFAVLVLLLGFGVSLLSGLLGIGGGIIMAPVLLYLPPLLGMEPLSMSEVTGLTITQGLSACLSAGWKHDRYRQMNRRLVLWMGTSIAVCALAGSVLSKWVSSEDLMVLFALLAIVAAVLMSFPVREDHEVVDGRKLAFSVPRAVLIASSIGLLGGMVGQGGSFILIPVMLHVLRLPTRVVIASNLGLVFFSALAGFIGKLSTGQIPGTLAIFLVLGALPGAQLGSTLSRQTHPRWLRRSLALVIAIAAVGIGIDAYGAQT